MVLNYKLNYKQNLITGNLLNYFGRDDVNPEGLEAGRGGWKGNVRRRHTRLLT